MPKGWCPEYFYFNPELEKEKSMEKIYEEIQYYSGEFFSDDSMNFKRQTDFMVPLPPLPALFYEGKFVKGIYLSEVLIISTPCSRELTNYLFQWHTQCGPPFHIQIKLKST